MYMEPAKDVQTVFDEHGHEPEQASRHAMILVVLAIAILLTTVLTVTLIYFNLSRSTEPTINSQGNMVGTEEAIDGVDDLSPEGNLYLQELSEMNLLNDLSVPENNEPSQSASDNSYRPYEEEVFTDYVPPEVTEPDTSVDYVDTYVPPVFEPEEVVVDVPVEEEIVPEEVVVEPEETIIEPEPQDLSESEQLDLLKSLSEDSDAPELSDEERLKILEELAE